MANPLTFLLPFRYNAMGSLLVIQSCSIDLAREVAGRLRALFPGCKIEGLIRDNDLGAVAPGDFDRVTAVRWEDRIQLVRDLRTRRFDAVVVLLSGSGSRSFLMIPYLLRTGAILMFNDHLDYFPLKLGRLTSLAQHVSGAQGGAGAVAKWALGRAFIVPAATLLLVASTARIYLRARRRRSA